MAADSRRGALGGTGSRPTAFANGREIVLGSFAAESAGSMESAPAARGCATRFLRTVFIDRIGSRSGGTRQLCGGQCVSRCISALAARARTAGAEHQLGAMGSRHGKRSEPGRSLRSARAGRDHAGTGHALSFAPAGADDGASGGRVGRLGEAVRVPAQGLRDGGASRRGDGCR